MSNTARYNNALILTNTCDSYMSKFQATFLVNRDIYNLFYDTAAGYSLVMCGIITLGVVVMKCFFVVYDKLCTPLLVLRLG